MTEGGIKNYLSTFIEAELTTTYADMSAITLSGYEEVFQGNVKFERVSGTRSGKPNMTFMPYDEFMGNVQTSTEDSWGNIHYRFTIKDNDPQKVIVAYYTKTTIETESGTRIIFNIYTELIDIYPVLSDYVMPFELPLIFMLTFRSGEFGEAVSNLALNGKVMIGIFDNIDESVTVDVEERVITEYITTNCTGVVQEGTTTQTELVSGNAGSSVVDPDAQSFSSTPVVQEIQTVQTFTTTTTVISNSLMIQALEVDGWIARLTTDFKTIEKEEETPSQSVDLTQEEKELGVLKETSNTTINSEENAEEINNNETAQNIIQAEKEKRALSEEELRKKLEEGEDIPIVNVEIESINKKTESKTEIAKTQSSKIKSTQFVTSTSKKISRENEFLGLIKNADGEHPEFYYEMIDTTEDRVFEGIYDPNGEYVKYLNMDYDEKIFGVSLNKKSDDKKESEDEAVVDVRNTAKESGLDVPNSEPKRNEDKKYTTIDLPTNKNYLMYYIEQFNSTANLEGILRYLISVLSGEEDEKAVSIDDYINGFGSVVFNEINVGGSASDNFIKFLHAWEGHTGITDDGKYYIVGDDGAGHPTVGYGIDILKSGFAGRFTAAGYGTSMGSKVPVEFVDALEKEELSNDIKFVESKTAGLNLTEYQKYALVSRTYNCGANGAFTSRNGKTFVEAYKAYWDPKIDNELGKSENSSTFSHSLYTQYLKDPITSDGEVEPGLINRRKAEWLLFKYGYFNRINTYYTESSEVDGGTIVQNAVKLHKWLREKGYRYAQAGINIPVDTNGQGKTIDCSSYVSWVLYESGFNEFKGYQVTSAVFRKNPWGWQQIGDITQAKAGDILCYNGHVEIYAGSVTGGKARVYNCGGAKSIAAAEDSNSGYSINSILLILRPPQK